MSIALLLVLCVAVLVGGIGSVVMISIFAQLSRKVQGLESGQGGGSVQRLESEVAALRAEVDAANSTVMQLEERLDFTEKLLSKGPE